MGKKGTKGWAGGGGTKQGTIFLPNHYKNSFEVESEVLAPPDSYFPLPSRTQIETNVWRMGWVGRRDTFKIELAKSLQVVESEKVGTGILQPTNKSSPKVNSGPWPVTHVPVAVVPNKVKGDVGCCMAWVMHIKDKYTPPTLPPHSPHSSSTVDCRIEGGGMGQRRIQIKKGIKKYSTNGPRPPHGAINFFFFFGHYLKL